jgi:L,D-transpeptidase catalytic domain
MTKSLATLLFTATCAFLSSCQTRPATTSTRTGVDGRTFDVPAYRPANPGAVRVKASVNNRAVYVMEGNRPLLVSPATFGKPGTGTPLGSFTAYTKIRNKRSMSYGKYPMPFWVEFKSAYGFHGGWIHPQNCTHGCVRLPWNVAPKFYDLVRTGTPISIASSQPEDATIGQNIPRLNDAPAPEWPNDVLWTDRVFHLTDNRQIYSD